MMSAPSCPQFVARFVSHLPLSQQKKAWDVAPRLEQPLLQLLERAHAVQRRTSLMPTDDELLCYIAARMPEHGNLFHALQQLNLEDLLLAWACGQGDGVAIAECERCHFSIVDAALAQMPNALNLLTEIKQQLRQRLLVKTEDQPPRITQYSGRGELRSWLRIAAIRCALNLLHKEGREVELEQKMLNSLAAPEEDQELHHLKRQYRQEFKRAFAKALASLSDRERNVLNYHYLEGLNIDQIGAIYRVHRATVARWLDKTRDILLQRTRQSLMAQLHISGEEFDSMMRLIQSQLDVSLEELLPPKQRE
jgi:RNA polymerase sigma-70 factor (ECF subfamily)